MAGATKLLTAGGGGVVLTPASSIASDVTVQIPASNGTVITTASSGGVIPTAALPAGTVLQVVQGTVTGDTGTSSTSFVSTGLYATITPTSSTSKILVTVASNISYVNTSGSALWWNVFRGTSGQGSGGTVGANGVYALALGSPMYIPTGYSFLDSPAGSSALTYTVMQKISGSGSVGFCYGLGSGNLATITLMEIAA